MPGDRITTSHIFSCSVGLLSAGPGTDSSKANLSLHSVLQPSRERCPQERGTEQGQMGPKRKELPAQVTIITGLWVHCQLEWQLTAQQLGQMAYLQPVMGSRPTPISLLPLERDRERKGSHSCQLVSVKGGGSTVSVKGLFVCLLLISICSFFKAEILFIYCDFKRVWGITFNLEDIPCRIFVPQELITQLLTAEAF